MSIMVLILCVNLFGSIIHWPLDEDIKRNIMQYTVLIRKDLMSQDSECARTAGLYHIIISFAKYSLLHINSNALSREELGVQLHKL